MIGSIASILTCVILMCTPVKENFSNKVFKLAEKQYSAMDKENRMDSLYPRSGHSGKVFKVPVDNWTVGFYPGVYWLLYEQTGQKKWKDIATRITESLVSNQYNTSNHDVGFMMGCSYGNGLRLTGNKAYEAILVQTAKSLVQRYSPVVKSIMSWNPRNSVDRKNRWDFPVIIDNLMNLDLLLQATKMTNDSSFYYIARNHAITTLENHIRPDYSTYHVVNYDPNTGKPLHQQTAQGFSDNSTWARGQAWSIYGFTNVYENTHEKQFLDAAERLADYFMSHPNLPEDLIPYWDFNVKESKVKEGKTFINYRDVSAACITASALLKLHGYVDAKKSRCYFKLAERILINLSTPAYLAKKGTNNNFLLMHSVGNYPVNLEVDVPLVYADYYYLEALLAYEKLKKNI